MFVVENHVLSNQMSIYSYLKAILSILEENFKNKYKITAGNYLQ
jgi:hypothetical protein